MSIGTLKPILGRDVPMPLPLHGTANSKISSKSWALKIY